MVGVERFELPHPAPKQARYQAAHTPKKLIMYIILLNIFNKVKFKISNKKIKFAENHNNFRYKVCLHLNFYMDLDLTSNVKPMFQEVKSICLLTKEHLQNFNRFKKPTGEYRQNCSYARRYDCFC